LHRAGYAALGLTDWSYERHEVGVEQLADFVAGLDDDWRGLSLTMPLKAACLEVATDVTERAARAGAGNTLVRTEHGWLAENTDIPGLVAALRPAWRGWPTAAVLGAGATARSSVLALEELGVSEVHLYARNRRRAAELVEWAAVAAPGLSLEVRDLGDWARAKEPAVLSTLPAGVADGSGLRARSGLLFDAVYTDWPTPLATAASAAGMDVIGGLELLVAQARLQFRLFTGQDASELVMRAAAAVALRPKLVLAGFMGAGKTTVGRLVAERLGLPFVDSDEVIVAVQGRSVPEIFLDLGEPPFRQLEAMVIADLLTGPPAVIALGGGAVMTPKVNELLKAHTVVLLDISLAQSLARMGPNPGRPLLARPDLPQLFADRQPVYRQAADVILPAAGEPEQVAESVLRALGQQA